MKTFGTILTSVLLIGIAFGGGNKQRLATPVIPVEPAVDGNIQTAAPTPDGPRSPFLIGTPTGLSGYYDYQCNGGAFQSIRVNPTTGEIHTVMMIAEDSTNFASTRRVAYSYSTDDGGTWNTFNNVRVPSRQAGFPSLDLGKGPIDGAAIVADHNDGGSGLGSYVYVDFPSGGGAFAELTSPPQMAGGSDEPIWPCVAGANDGSVVIQASQSTASAVWHNRTADYTTWGSWIQYMGPTAGGWYTNKPNGNGHVGSLALGGTNYDAYWTESIDNGATWPPTATQVYPGPPGRIDGADTLRCWVGLDFMYNGDTPLMVFNEQNLTAAHINDGWITFYSAATGFNVVATPQTIPEIVPADSFLSQTNHLNLGYPVMGWSGNTLVIVFMGFQRDTSAANYNYGDIYYSISNDLGATWSTPVNVTNSQFLDERYPSISPWSPTGYAYVTWQEDTEPGSSAQADPGSLLSRSRQVFYKILLSDVPESGEVASTYSLGQNYPNPFNPATKIRFTIPVASDVQLTVYNALGQEVATLVSAHRNQGTYEVDFSGEKLSSGVYFYTLKAGRFVDTRKMILVK